MEGFGKDAMLTSISTLTLSDAVPKAENSKCHFFKLSGELRNRIYEYVLSHDSPLKFEHNPAFDTGKFYAQLPPKQGSHDLSTLAVMLNRALLEVNELRFVNKQLHAETKGLEIWYNDLTFKMLEDADHFFQHCAPVHLKHIRTVTYPVRSRIPAIQESEVQQQASINKFCHANPSALVRAELIGFSLGTASDYYHMVLLEVVLRRTSSLAEVFFPPPKEQEGLEVAEQYAKDLGISPSMYPSNHRFFFPVEGADRASFEKVFAQRFRGQGTSAERSLFVETMLRLMAEGL